MVRVCCARNNLAQLGEQITKTYKKTREHCEPKAGCRGSLALDHFQCATFLQKGPAAARKRLLLLPRAGASAKMNRK
jgi:hypothetical protein